MSGTINRCCPCEQCDRTECISGDTIDTGCCIACEDLIMWSERPAFSLTQRYYLEPDDVCLVPWDVFVCGDKPEDLIYQCTGLPSGPECDPASYPLVDCPPTTCNGGSVGKLVNYTVYADELEPVQTIYRFYGTYWRPLGLYSGGYPVHNGTNTLRTALAGQLPVKPDPILQTEEISPGFNRCKYETLGDSPRMSAWDQSTLVTMKTCLAGESPCAKTDCISWISPTNCTPQEIEKNYCDSNFILSPGDIIRDLKRGYLESSATGSTINCCYPLCDNPSCAQVSNPPVCECNSKWLTLYRRRKLLDDYRHTWGTDVECYNDSSFALLSNAYSVDPAPFIFNYNPSYDASYDTGTNQFRLSDHWLFNMTFERWWLLGQDEHGHSAVFFDVPGSSGSEPNPTIANPSYPWQTDDLVPKWWIYACSAVPFFQFEMQDALNPMNSAASAQYRRNPVINSSQFDLFVQIREEGESVAPYGEYRLQSLWESLSRGGYFKAKDWRAEQLQAYKELAERFPGAGYQTYANKTVDQMPELGPFRKRYYASHTEQKRKPYLRAELVPKSALQLQAECYIDYPGGFSGSQQDIDDYYFWAERQWVYFRGVPAGWTWANWTPCLSGKCADLTPCDNTDINDQIKAILAGCGRATGDCIESWYNQPQVSYTVNNTENNDCIDTTGEGQSEVPCNTTFGPIGDFTDCDCCKQRCSIEDLSTNCDQFCIGDCTVSIPIEQCSVPEGTSYSTDGSPFGFTTDDISEETFFCGCQPTPIQGCSDCSKISITAYCQGVHIIVAQYATENKNISAFNECDEKSNIVSKTRCAWNAHTFLTTAQNFYRFNDIINACESSRGNISMKNLWPEVKNTHVVPNPIRVGHFAALNDVCPTADAEQYTVIPACYSGVAWYSDVSCCDTANCGGLDTIPCLQRMPCVSETHGVKWPQSYSCPPVSQDNTDSSREEIINLLGYTPICEIP